MESIFLLEPTPNHPLNQKHTANELPKFVRFLYGKYRKLLKLKLAPDMDSDHDSERHLFSVSYRF